MDNREFKVGDRVWSLLLGWGSVKRIDSNIEEAYPVYVVFDSGKGKCFTKHGIFHAVDKNPSLFHANQGKIEFDTDEPIELVDGQPIWVRDSETHEWKPRHSAHCAEGGGVYCYWNGRTKHSSAGEKNVTHWQHFRTTDPALDVASQQT